jgi:hypothetical protein
MDGKMNAANVIKFSTENNLRLKNNVAFQLPIIKLPTLKSNAVLTASK